MPVEDPTGGTPADEAARRYADSGPSTGSRRRPEVMIDRDVRDTERTAERFQLRSAQEVASRFASLPGEPSSGKASGCSSSFVSSAVVPYWGALLGTVAGFCAMEYRYTAIHPPLNAP